MGLRVGRQESVENSLHCREISATRAGVQLGQRCLEPRFGLSLEQVGAKVEPHPLRPVIVVAGLDKPAAPRTNIERFLST